MTTQFESFRHEIGSASSAVSARNSEQNSRVSERRRRSGSRRSNSVSTKWADVRSGGDPPRSGRDRLDGVEAGGDDRQAGRRPRSRRSGAHEQAVRQHSAGGLISRSLWTLSSLGCERGEGEQLAAGRARRPFRAARTIPLEPDDEGEVVATLVRYRPAPRLRPDEAAARRRGCALRPRLVGLLLPDPARRVLASMPGRASLRSTCANTAGAFARTRRRATSTISRPTTRRSGRRLDDHERWRERRGGDR